MKGSRTPMDNAVAWWYTYRRETLALPDAPFPLVNVKKLNRFAPEPQTELQLEMSKLWMARTVLQHIVPNELFQARMARFCDDWDLDEYIYQPSHPLIDKLTQRLSDEKTRSPAQVLYWRGATAINQPWPFLMGLNKKPKTQYEKKSELVRPTILGYTDNIKGKPNLLFWDERESKLVLQPGCDLYDWMELNRIKLGYSPLPMRRGERMKKMPEVLLRIQVDAFSDVEARYRRNSLHFNTKVPDALNGPIELESSNQYVSLCSHWMYTQLDRAARMYDIDKGLNIELLSFRLP